MKGYDNERAHYRVVFPVSGRPHFQEFGGNVSHSVVDCSESGLRFLSANPTPPLPGAEIEGTIVFPDGEEARIEGVVVRSLRGEVAVHLVSRPIPFAVIVQQQRYLRHARRAS